jgi:hypothetical protein
MDVRVSIYDKIIYLFMINSQKIEGLFDSNGTQELFLHEVV